MHCCKLESKLRVDLKPSHHKQINKQTQKESKKTELTMWCDGCINDLDLGNHPQWNMYVKWTLYAINVCSHTSQLFFNKVKNIKN